MVIWGDGVLFFWNHSKDNLTSQGGQPGVRLSFQSSIRLRNVFPTLDAGIDRLGLFGGLCFIMFCHLWSPRVAAGARVLRWTCGYNEPHQCGGLDRVICQHMGSDWARLPAECTKKFGQHGFLGRNGGRLVAAEAAVFGFHSAFESKICTDFQVLLDTEHSEDGRRKKNTFKDLALRKIKQAGGHIVWDIGGCITIAIEVLLLGFTTTVIPTKQAWLHPPRSREQPRLLREDFHVLARKYQTGGLRWRRCLGKKKWQKTERTRVPTEILGQKF